MFRHPKYYKELRKLRNKLDPAISDSTATANDSVRPGPGLKHQASSTKQQASSKPEPVQVQEATSVKPQQTSSDKRQAKNNKQEVSSPK